MNDHEVIADFSRRWANTYVWMNMDNLKREVLVRITSVEEHPKKVAVINVTSKEFGALRVNFGSETSSLKFKHPPVGVFQYGSDSYLLQRRPQRQWRRGLCSDNATILPVHRYITGKAVSWDIGLVQAAYDHNVSTVQEALVWLSKGKVRAVALENAFTLMLNPTTGTSGHVLLHWAEPVALVDVKTGKPTQMLNKHYTSLVESLYDYSK